MDNSQVYLVQVPWDPWSGVVLVLLEQIHHRLILHSCCLHHQWEMAGIWIIVELGHGVTEYQSLGGG